MMKTVTVIVALFLVGACIGGLLMVRSTVEPVIAMNQQAAQVAAEKAEPVTAEERIAKEAMDANVQIAADGFSAVRSQATSFAFAVVAIFGMVLALVFVLAMAGRKPAQTHYTEPPLLEPGLASPLLMKPEQPYTVVIDQKAKEKARIR